MRALILVLSLLWTGAALASDVPASAPISDRATADDICTKTCKSFDCGWSGLWKPAANGIPGLCDCGTERMRFVPGGSFTDDAGAMKACLDICTLNGDVYSGEWEKKPSLFSMCGCLTVTDYCPAAHESK